MRKKILTVLAALSCLCLAGCSSCFSDSGGGDTSTPTTAPTLGEFDIQSEMTVTQFSPITPEIPLVLLESGEPVDILFEVLNAKGEYVEISGGGFIASDRDGYTVRYLAVYNGQVLAEKTMTVHVKGSSVNVSATHEEFIEVGDEVQIQAQTEEGATLSYTVKCGDTPVDVSDSGVFVATKTGEHTVEIVATAADGATGDYSYTTYARRKGLVGEIETFGEDWNDLIKLSSVGRPGWTRVTTDDTTLAYGDDAGSGLLDRFGEKSEYIAFTTSGIPEDQTGNSYLNVQVDARYDVEYYEQLAREGYEYVSIWIYMDSQINHLNYVYTDPSYSSQFFREGSETSAATNPVLKPGQWTELKLGLYDGSMGMKDWLRSFISGYPFYKNGTNFIRIDNSQEDNIPYGQEPDKMTIYVGGIFAMRETERVSVDQSLGEVFDVKKAVDAEGTLYVGEGFSYRVFENGAEVPANDVPYLPLGMHDLQVQVMKDGEFYQLRNVELAVIDSTKAMPLQDVTADKTKAIGVQYGTEKKGQLSVETPAGRAESHYKMTYGAGQNEEPGIKLMFGLSKKALEKFSGGYLFFDYYLHGDAASMNLLAVNNSTYYKKAAPVVKDTWSTIYIPVDYIVEHYDNIVAGFGAKEHTGKLVSFGNWSNTAGYFYISEVRVAKDLQPREVVNNTVSMTADDFTDSYTISDTQIASLGLTGKKLSAELDGVKSANGTVVAIQGKQDGDELLYNVYLELENYGIRQLVYSERIKIIDNTLVRTFVAINKANAHALQYGGKTDNQLSVVQNPESQTGSFFKIAYGAGENYEAGLRVKPTMDKSLLQKYLGGTFTFDIWVSAEETTLQVLCYDQTVVPAPTDKDPDATKTTNHYNQTIRLSKGAWTTVTISVADVLASYDTMVNTFEQATHLGKLFGLAWNNNNEAGTIYVGNFAINPYVPVAETPVDYETIWGARA